MGQLIIFTFFFREDSRQPTHAKTTKIIFPGEHGLRWFTVQYWRMHNFFEISFLHLVVVSVFNEFWIPIELWINIRVLFTRFNHWFWLDIRILGQWTEFRSHKMSSFCKFFFLFGLLNVLAHSFINEITRLSEILC